MTLHTTDNPKMIIIVAVLLFVIGAALTAYGVSEYRTQSEVLDDVVEVDATVTDVDITPYHNGEEADIRADRWSEYEESLTWYLTIEFEYAYEGETYRSSNFSAVGAIPTYDEWDDARDAEDEYAVGDRVTAYVPPDDPGEAFLEPGMPFAIYGVIGFGAVLLIGAIWLPFAHRFDIGTDVCTHARGRWPGSLDHAGR